MKYATFCSGIEAPSVAWHGLGWKPVLFSEIDPYCCKLLSHHYPDVPNVGDMKKFYNEVKTNPIKYRGLVDLICAGTPCQSFSTAGLRKGLDDPRGNLALIFLGIIDILRPTWVLWENVPGVLSSWTATGAPDENGEWEETNDFHTFISALNELGYGVSSRVLDAQYFGVPQRRRRVFVVGHLGSWTRSAAVLFDSSCMRGNPLSSRKTGQKVATLSSTGVGTCGADDNQAQAGHIVGTLNASFGKSFGQSAQDSCHGHSHLVFGGGSTHGDISVAPTLNVGAQARNDFDSEAIIFDSRQSITQSSVPGPISPTCDTDCGAFSVYNMRGREGGSELEEQKEGLASLRAASGGSSNSYILNSGLRMITEIEAERLQGFPYNYTLVPVGVTKSGKVKMAKGRHRYKGIGNSMAVPVMEWLGNRIDQVQKLINDGTI